jgi:hypothetical protein
MVAAPIVVVAAIATLLLTRPREPGQREIAVVLAPITRDTAVPEVELGADVATASLSFTLDVGTRSLARRVTFTSGTRRFSRAFQDPMIVPARELVRATWEAVGAWEITIEDAAGARLAVLALRVR